MASDIIVTIEVIISTESGYMLLGSYPYASAEKSAKITVDSSAARELQKKFSAPKSDPNHLFAGVETPKIDKISRLDLSLKNAIDGVPALSTTCAPSCPLSITENGVPINP